MSGVVLAGTLLVDLLQAFMGFKVREFLLLSSSDRPCRGLNVLVL